MRYLILALGLSFSIVSCSKGDNKGTEQQPIAAETYIDLSYGTDSKQKLDIYLPESRTSKTRTLIVIHGGGGPQEINLISTVISLNYRNAFLVIRL